MKNTVKHLLAAGLVSVGVFSFTACADCSCCGAVGRWAIQKPGAYWLGIFKGDDGKATASFLWGGGSPNPQAEVKIDGANASMKQCTKGDKDPAKARFRVTTLAAKGDTADLVFTTTDGTGKKLNEEKATAKRIPALPPAPDVSKAVYGAPVNPLADGIDGWEAMNKNLRGPVQRLASGRGASLPAIVLTDSTGRVIDGTLGACPPETFAGWIASLKSAMEAANFKVEITGKLQSAMDKELKQTEKAKARKK